MDRFLYMDTIYQATVSYEGYLTDFGGNFLILIRQTDTFVIFCMQSVLFSISAIVQFTSIYLFLSCFVSRTACECSPVVPHPGERFCLARGSSGWSQFWYRTCFPGSCRTPVAHFRRCTWSWRHWRWNNIPVHSPHLYAGAWWCLCRWWKT